MKIGLILSANIKMCPYIEIFCKILDENCIEYDIISWDRESLGDERGIVYHYPSPNTNSKFGKFYGYYKFHKFTKQIIRENKYDKLVVFGAAIAVFMYEFLNKHYKGKFWLDYRDLTIEQSFMRRFKKVCDISSNISISSPGFKRVFPAKYDFILSHNFDIDEVRRALQNPYHVPFDIKSPIVISTIGCIRDYPANVEIIDSLANDHDFKVKFIGRGPSAESLAEYVKQYKISNVEFQGFYLKDDEWQFYEQTDLVNIYLMRIKSHETPMANRFYKSLIFRKPMIVTNRSTQSNYVEKYQLGLSLENCSDLSSQIKSFINSYDPDAFAKRCDLLLNEFVADYDDFYNKFLQFFKNE